MTTDRPNPEGSTRRPLPPPLTPPPDAPVGPGGEVSASLGDLLLRGWAMLGDACPRCESTPLMREPAGGGGGGGGGARRMYCVRCRAWAGALPAVGAPAPALVRPPMTRPSPPPQPPVVEAAASPAPPPPPPRQPSRPTTATPTTTSLSSSQRLTVAYQPSTAAAMADAEAALAATLASATLALAGLDVAADPGRASDLVHLVGETAGALSKVCGGRGGSGSA